MGEQRTFAGLAWSTKGKVTRRERFLAEMNAVVPWSRLMALMEPHYPTSGKGRQKLGLEKMLRSCFVQQWFDVSDPGAEDAIYDSESIRRFVGVALRDDRVPDESTILRFRHLLEEGRLLLKASTIVDATIIHAPNSTKNESVRRDPEMKQTRRGNAWYFGMKVHTGTDKRGLTHSLTVTDTGEADIKQMPDLLHREEREVYGDQAYWKESDRQSFEASNVRY